MLPHKRSIVVADDDRSTLALFQDALDDEGYRTVCCTGAAAASAQMERDHPDLLIVDLHMEAPDSGLQLIAWLHRQEWARRVPVLVCSADTRYLQEHGAQLRALGCDLVGKPFGLDDLLGRVAAAVGVISLLMVL